MPYLILDAGAALWASRDLLDDPISFVTRRLNEPPVVRHCLLPALHVHAFEVGVDEFALVELGKVVSNIIVQVRLQLDLESYGV